MYQKQYNPLLGIKPPSQWRCNRAKGRPWLPLKDEEGNVYPWIVNGKLDPVFLQWLAQRWSEKFKVKDIFQAKADVIAYMMNNPDRLEIKWIEYQSAMHAKFENAQARLQNGVLISEGEKEELRLHSGALTRSLPETSPLSMIAPEKVDLLPQLQASPSPTQQQAKQINLLQELPNVTRSIPKAKELTPNNEIEEINVWLADPILRKEIQHKALAKFDCVLNEWGEPIQAIAYKDADEINRLEKVENNAEA